MSEDAASQMEEAPDAASEDASAPVDASLKVDPSALDDEEADFAKALGFGAEDEAESAPSTAAAPAPSTPDAPAPARSDADEAEGDAAEAEGGSDAEGATGDEVASDVEAAHEPEPAIADAPTPSDADEDEPDATGAPVEVAADATDADAPTADDEPPADDADDLEEIHPRSASVGEQDLLQARADEVLERPESEPTADTQARDSSAPTHDDGALERAVAAERAAHEETRSALNDARAEIAQLASALDAAGPSAEEEKTLEALRSELDAVAIERDRLIDEIARVNGQLSGARERAERLETSLKAARSALIPLPEGERALRAEVLGLRARLDEAAEENVRLAGEVANVATELAIATARAEDRQHEVDHYADEAARLEAEAADQATRLEQALAERRTAVDLATRLQAENAELRSTQAALEETLEARDLEIHAREEHLRVLREGLADRERQLLEAEDRVAEEHRRVEALERELAHAALDRQALAEKIARREARIASLNATLERIEEVMGPHAAAARSDDAPARPTDAD